MSRIALVTGASGFVGRHLIPVLLARGFRVRGLYRKPEQTKAAAELGIEHALGDVTERATLLEAVRGATHVFHLAALIGGRRGDVDRVNRAGTRNLLDACGQVAPDLARFVLVSSIAAVGPDREGRILTEDTPPRPVSSYGRSKLAQEAEVSRLARFPWCAVRPPLLYGPSDRLTLPLFRLAARGFSPIISGGLRRLSLLQVRDAARAIALAGDREGVDGKKILLAGPESATFPALREAMQEALGRRVREVRIPLSLLQPMGEALSLVLGDHLLGQLAYERQEADAEEARRHLGFTAEVQLHSGIAEAMRWYVDNGWV